MWLTWANATGVDSFCLSLTMPGDPFHTCLIGIPISNFTGFTKWVGARGRPYMKASRSRAENRWCNVTRDGTKLGMCKRLGIRPNSKDFQAGMMTQSLNETTRASRTGSVRIGTWKLLLVFELLFRPKINSYEQCLLVPRPQNKCHPLNQICHGIRT